ncbi:hypothetical protein SeLEV6574_g07504, partial [Synchytrium endobioticum]
VSSKSFRQARRTSRTKWQVAKQIMDARSAYSSSKRSSSKRRGWRKTANSLKLAWFESLLAMMKSSGVEKYPYIALIALAIENLQMLSFAFYSIDWGVAGNNVGIAVTLTQIEHEIVHFTEYEVLLALVAMCLALIAVMLVLATYVIWSFYSKEFKSGVWPLRVLRITINLLQSVLYLPVLTTLMASSKCPNTDDGLALYGCYTGIHAIVLLLSLAAALVFIPFSFLMSLASFEPNPRSSIVAEATPTTHLLDNVIKTILVIVYSTPLHPTGKAVFYLACCCFEVWLSFGYLPFYRVLPNQLRCICSGMLAVAAAITLVASCVNDHHDVFFYVLVASMALAGIASWRIFRRRWMMVCPQHVQRSVKLAKARNPEHWAKEFFKRERIRAFRAVIIRTNFIWFTEDPELIALAEQIYVAALELYPKCSNLALSYGMFLKLVKDDLSSSSYWFKKAERLNPPIHVQFVVYQAEMDRRERMATREGASVPLDAVDRVEFKHLMLRANYYHRQTAIHASKFWSALASGKCNAIMLNQLAILMERNEKGAARAYGSLMSRFSHIPAVLVNHIAFMNLTAQSEEAADLQADYDELMDNMEQENATEPLQNPIQLMGSAAVLEMNSPDRLQREASVFGRLSSRPRRGSGSAIDGLRLAPLPPAITRSRGEKRAHAIYRRMVKAYQTKQATFMGRVVLAVMFLIVSIDLGFVIVQELLVGSLRQGLDSLYAIATLGALWAAAPTICRALQQSAFDARVFAVAQQRLRSICSASTGLVYTAYDTMQSLVKTTPGASQDYLFEDTIPAVYYYKNTSRPYVSENVSFINFVLDMSFACSAVGSLSANDFLSGAVNTNQYWRFLLTNGGFTADSFVLVLKYTELIGERAAYGQVVICWSLCAVAVVFIICCGFFLFKPAVAEAKRSRQLAIEAFLEIPKDVVLKTYMKYKFEPSEGRYVDADEVSDDEDDENSDIPSNTSRPTDVFKKITLWYCVVLTLLGIFLSVHMGVGLTYLQSVVTINKQVSLAGSAPTVLLQATTAVVERAQRDPYSYYSDAELQRRGQVYLDAFKVSLNALLYGNTSLGYDRPTVEPTIFYTGEPYNNGTTYLQIVRQLMSTLQQAIRQDVLTHNDSSLTQIAGYLANCVVPMGIYLNQTNDAYLDVYNDLNTFVLQAWFPVFMVVLFIIYVRQVRGIMKAVMSENERTLRVLLMLPVEVVSQIESIRRLLHMEVDFEVPELRRDMGPGSSQVIRQSQLTRLDSGGDTPLGSASIMRDVKAFREEGPEGIVPSPRGAPTLGLGFGPGLGLGLGLAPAPAPDAVTSNVGVAYRQLVSGDASGPLSSTVSIQRQRDGEAGKAAVGPPALSLARVSRKYGNDSTRTSVGTRSPRVHGEHSRVLAKSTQQGQSWSAGAADEEAEGGVGRTSEVSVSDSLSDDEASVA